MPTLPLLEQARRARGLTQAALARSAGISVPTLRALQRGSGTLRSLQEVMRILDLDWGWMPIGTDPVQPIVARRLAKGLTQADLARRVGCARGTIIDLEKNLGGSVAILIAVLSALGLRPALRSRTRDVKPGLVPPRNAPSRDMVMTPPDLAAAILSHFEGRMTGRILDPARGCRAFFDQLPAHLERDWCEVTEGRDFLTSTRPVDWIVTNPPWSRLRDFTRHAMTLAPNIVWLAPLVNLTTKARLRDIEAAGFGIAEILWLDTPKGWPQSGFQLAAVHLKKGHTGGWKAGRLGCAGQLQAA
jgi:transcriptional regulator with XRE-family HTH domain